MFLENLSHRKKSNIDMGRIDKPTIFKNRMKIIHKVNHQTIAIRENGVTKTDIKGNFDMLDEINKAVEQLSKTNNL